MAQAPSDPKNRWVEIGICASLTVLVWIVFGATLHNDFVNYDDDAYVAGNAVIQRGLSGGSIGWAFSHAVASNWHPVTMLSHILDCQFYGLKPGGHHFTNVLLHAVAAILLFLVLRGMTQRIWPAAFVAAVFAIHPLRVESVAWVAERKDVLSGVFFMLTLWAYWNFVAALKIQNPKSKFHYGLALVFFALGLMSKPMLVSVPIVLLLLDYWPLKRISNFKFQISNAAAREESSINAKPWPKLVLEKLPFAFLSAVICAVTLFVQDKARQAAESISISARLGNAIVSCAIYVWQLFWPARLAVFYPYPADGWPVWQVGLALLFLVGVSAFAFYRRKERPYLVIGWLWFLVMLVPVIGLVQVGLQSRADRYTYLPEIGLCLAVTWAVADWTAKWRNRMALGAGAAVSLVALAAVARNQTSYWQNSETLWLHTINCTASNAVAESNLGNYYLHQGKLNDAIARCQAALAIKPDYADANNCLGYALLQEGKTGEAISYFQQSLRTEPDFAAAHNNYGLALLQSGNASAAAVELEAAVKIKPDDTESHNNLGVALLRTGQPAAAAVEYAKALDISPDFPSANNNLAWLLATCPDASVRDGARAITLSQHANQLLGNGNLMALRTLAAAYAEAGKFSDAAQTTQQALQMAMTQRRNAWANTLRGDLGLYQAGQPLRDAGK